MICGEEKESLRNRILELGFDVARFSNLEPISGEQLKSWLDNGYHADMEWLARSIEKRLNPNLVLEGACSVLMLGVNYLPSEEEAARQQTGFAKYSVYRDYHDTVLSGLKEVGRLLEESCGLGPYDYRYYVDAGPVIERGWAAAAGLGWQGKNGMLISKEHGNWMLLASILIRLEIEPDSPLKKTTNTPTAAGEAKSLGLLCGKCTRCIDACPTQAIVQPGILDTRRCISYQTIENRGSIPRELRSKFGGRVFGCDICLDVCPWNRFAEAGRLQLLEARYAVADLSLLDLLRMDAEGFREAFRKMPQKRTKLRGLKRNACVVAGNLLECEDWWPEGCEPDSPSGTRFLSEIRTELERLIQEDEEPLVRGHAVWAMYRLFGDESVAFLSESRAREADADVQDEYLAASIG